MKDHLTWALPGGYVKKEENIDDDAAVRILEDRTGTKNIYLQQFYTFGKVNRSENDFAEYSNVDLVIDEYSDACEWQSIDNLPEFMMDHMVIFNISLLTLREQLNNHPIWL